jgi:hypothetical protein
MVDGLAGGQAAGMLLQAFCAEKFASYRRFVVVASDACRSVAEETRCQES